MRLTVTANINIPDLADGEELTDGQERAAEMAQQTLYLHLFWGWRSKRRVQLAGVSDERPLRMDSTIAIFEVNGVPKTSVQGAVMQWLYEGRSRAMTIRELEA